MRNPLGEGHPGRCCTYRQQSDFGVGGKYTAIALRRDLRETRAPDPAHLTRRHVELERRLIRMVPPVTGRPVVRRSCAKTVPQGAACVGAMALSL